MALPKVGLPSYELELPSSGKTVKYRPFLVKEEKVLLLALESQDEKQITNSVLDLLKSCIITRGVKVETLPSFDIEYLFLKIRAASIGEIIELLITCNDDGETQVPTTININEVEVVKPEGHSNKVMLDDNIGVVMKYPAFDRFVKNVFIGNPVETDEVFDIIAESIDQIFDNEEVYDSSTTTKKELVDWVGSLTSKQFESIRKFYETSPKLSHTFKVKNPNTGVESEYTFEGLQSFFG